jgi:hypothetical protein
MLCVINLDLSDQSSLIHSMVLLEHRLLHLQNLDIFIRKNFDFMSVTWFLNILQGYKFAQRLFYSLILFFLQKMSAEHAMMLPVCICVLTKLFFISKVRRC